MLRVGGYLRILPRVNDVYTVTQKIYRNELGQGPVGRGGMERVKQKELCVQDPETLARVKDLGTKPYNALGSLVRNLKSNRKPLKGFEQRSSVTLSYKTSSWLLGGEQTPKERGISGKPSRSLLWEKQEVALPKLAT